VAYYRRAYPRYVRLKAFLESGQLGELSAVHYACHRPKASAGGWRLDVASSGGGLFVDIGSHLLDLLDFLLGPLRQVKGVATRSADASQADPEDAVAASFLASNVAVGSAIWNFRSTGTSEVLELLGEKGKITIPEPMNGNSILIDFANGRCEHWEMDPPSPSVQQPLIQAVTDAIVAGDRGLCPSSAESALRTATYIDSILQDFYGGRQGAFWERPATWEPSVRGVVLDLEPLPRETKEEFDARGNELCYHALSLTHSLPNWVLPASGHSAKDYIQYPKPNGYRSLHTTFVHMDVPVPLEVQIRTREMHDVAEYGMAAHVAYKGEQNGEHDSTQMVNRRVAWLASLTDKDGELGADPLQFVQEVLKEELGARCFVFLRDGQILNISRGCTVLDAAFKIHTEVGMHMLYAMVNGKKVAPTTTLQNGDEINIITSSEASPKVAWLDYVYLRSTRSKLAQHFRKEDRTSDSMVDVAALLATAATTAVALPLF
ncbi:unnamed protein product, partial [Polarella glacialis]